MRWKNKYHADRKEPSPQPGERRFIWRFAFMPIKCSDDVTVWLGRYRVLQEYTRYKEETDWGNSFADIHVRRIWLKKDDPYIDSGSEWRDVWTHGAKHRDSTLYDWLEGKTL